MCGCRYWLLTLFSVLLPFNLASEEHHPLNHHVCSFQTVSAEGFTPLLRCFLLSSPLEGLGKTQAHITRDGAVAAACASLTGHNRVSEMLQCQCGHTGQPGANRGVRRLNLVGEKRDGTEAQACVDLLREIPEAGSDGHFDRVS